MVSSAPSAFVSATGRSSEPRAISSRTRRWCTASSALTPGSPAKPPPAPRGGTTLRWTRRAPDTQASPPRIPDRLGVNNGLNGLGAGCGGDGGGAAEPDLHWRRDAGLGLPRCRLHALHDAHEHCQRAGLLPSPAGVRLAARREHQPNICSEEPADQKRTIDMGAISTGKPCDIGSSFK